MARRRGSARRRRRGGSGFLYKLLSVFLICGCLVAAITLFFRLYMVSHRTFPIDRFFHYYTAFL